MKTRFVILLSLGIATSTALLAHTGVKDPQVKARMDLLSSIALITKSPGTMAKSGQIDAAQVVENANALAQHADQIEVRLKDPATDPKSKSRPEIWQDMDGSLSIANDLQSAALDLASAPATLPSAMGKIGKTCDACHEDYRVKK